jgi:hypothetical protein
VPRILTVTESNAARDNMLKKYILRNYRSMAPASQHAKIEEQLLRVNKEMIEKFGKIFLRKRKQ